VRASLRDSQLLLLPYRLLLRPCPLFPCSYGPGSVRRDGISAFYSLSGMTYHFSSNGSLNFCVSRSLPPVHSSSIDHCPLYLTYLHVPCAHCEVGIANWIFRCKFLSLPAHPTLFSPFDLLRTFLVSCHRRRQNEEIMYLAGSTNELTSHCIAGLFFALLAPSISHFRLGEMSSKVQQDPRYRVHHSFHVQTFFAD